MPSNLNPLGALPSRFRKPRLLIVGSGDVAQRLTRQLAKRWRVMVLVRRDEAAPAWRELGAKVLKGDLDDVRTLGRLSGLAQRVVHLAPPPTAGHRDPRTRNLIKALSLRSPPQRLVYASTTGVYGDARGDVVNECRQLAPLTDRAHRRIDAETQLRSWGQNFGIGVSVLRIPGIHADDREGSLRQRLLRAAPVLIPEQDIYTNHIQADDLARMVHWSIWGALPQRCYNVNDDTDLKLGEALNRLADHLSLPRPERISWQQAQQTLSPMVLSFWRESRRIDAKRFKAEWPWRLRFPQLEDAYAPNAPT